MGSQLKSEVHEYMREHGVKYTEALRAVKAATPPTTSLRGNVGFTGPNAGQLLKKFQREAVTVPDMGVVHGISEMSNVKWKLENIPTYALQPGDVIQFEDDFGVYVGGGDVLSDGKQRKLTDIGTVANTFRAYPMTFADDAEFHRDNGTPPEGVTLRDVLGTDSSVGERWKRNELTEHLFVPMGYHPEDERVFGIDIADSRRGGMGPHGVVQGMTGSGKSAFLRTFITALAYEYSPTKLNIAYGDFISTVTATWVSSLPHTVYTGEWLNRSMEDRRTFFDFLSDEIAARRVMLRQSSVRDGGEYLELRKQDTSLPPMPHLLVVLDEVSEESIGVRDVTRITDMLKDGGDLNVHVLMSGQGFSRPTMIGMTGNFLTYGMSFTVGSESISRFVLGGSPEATKLPIGKGDGIVRYMGRNGEVTLERVRSLRLDTDPASDRCATVDEIVAASTSWKTN